MNETDFVPTFFVPMVILGEYDFHCQFSDSEKKQLTVKISIDSKNFQLTVKISTDSKKYQLTVKISTGDIFHCQKLTVKSGLPESYDMIF